MAYKMKHSKGKGFPFKESPMKHPISLHDADGNSLGHVHNDHWEDWDGEGLPPGYQDQYPQYFDEDGNYMGSLDSGYWVVPFSDSHPDSYPFADGTTLSYDDDTVDGDGDLDLTITDPDGNAHQFNMIHEGNQSGYGGYVFDKDKYGKGDPLIEASLDPNAQSILQQQAAYREEHGLHRWSRGNQDWEVEDNDYPWPDDDNEDGWGSGFDNLIEGPDGRPFENDGISYLWESPNYGQDDTEESSTGGGPTTYIPTFWEANQAVRPKPTSPPNTSPIGGGGPTDIRPNVSTTSDRPKPTSPPNTSPAGSGPSNERPNVSYLSDLPDSQTRPPTRPDTLEAVDIFGNVVNPIDNRGNPVPFTTTTIKMPPKFNFNKNKESDNNKDKDKKGGFTMAGFNPGSIGKGPSLI